MGMLNGSREGENRIGRGKNVGTERLQERVDQVVILCAYVSAACPLHFLTLNLCQPKTWLRSEEIHSGVGG